MTQYLSSTHALYKLSRFLEKTFIILCIFVFYNDLTFLLKGDYIILVVLLILTLRVYSIFFIRNLSYVRLLDLRSLLLDVKYLFVQKPSTMYNFLKNLRSFSKSRQLTFSLYRNVGRMTNIYWYPLFKKNSYYGYTRTVKSSDTIYKGKGGQ